MKILVTGATGLIGRALVLRLQQDGHDIVAWVRDRERARHQLGDSVVLVDGAPAPSAELDRAVSEADAIVNLAGAPILGRRWSRRHRRALRASRVDLTRRLVDAMARAPSTPPVLVSASAVGYYGDDVRRPVDESSPAGAGFVAELCSDWEQAARAASCIGSRVVNVRIGIVLAREGGALASMVPLFKAFLGGRLGSGRQLLSWIHLHDVVEVLATAVTDGRMRGPVNAVAGTVSNRELTRELADRLRRPALWVPAPALRLAVGKGARVLLGGQNVVAGRLRQLGYQYRYPTLTGALDQILGAPASVAIDRVGPDQLPDHPYLVERGASYRLTQRTEIPVPIDEVFDFFSRAGNLSLMTPPGLGFEIQTPTPIAMRRGTLIDYRIALGPLPMRWRTEIAAWEPGRRFVDVQLRGPYRSWWHEHRFIAQGERTVMEDRVFYSLPLGPLGRLAHWLQVSSMLQRIFGHRAQAIALRFGEPAPGSVVRLAPAPAPQQRADQQAQAS